MIRKQGLLYLKFTSLSLDRQGSLLPQQVLRLPLRRHLRSYRLHMVVPVLVWGNPQILELFLEFHCVSTDILYVVSMIVTLSFIPAYKSADPYTFLTFALLSKKIFSSHAVKSFLSWSGSSSGHAETATLEVWEMGKFLHWLSIRCSVTSSHIASSLDLFESPHLYTLLHSLSTIPFNAELLRFCDSRGDLDDNVAARKLLICLALSTEWKH